MLASILLVAAGAVSCSSRPAARPPEQVGKGARPHRLLTHCGIEWTHYDNRYWKTEPRNDGTGNPPQGWSNPFVEGTIEQVSDEEVVFRAGGRELRFRPASAGETPPPCD